MAFVLGLVSIWFQNHVAIGHDVVRTDSFWSRLAAAGWAVWYYFYHKTILPINVMPIYPALAHRPDQCARLSAGDFAGGRVCHLLDLSPKLGQTGLVRPGLRRAHVPAGAGVFEHLFLPVLVGGQSLAIFLRHRPDPALASVGLVWLSRFIPQDQLVRPLLCAMLLIVLGTLTWQQAGVYRNSYTLWSTTLEDNPDCFIGHNDLGFYLLEHGETTNALPHFQRAVELQADDEASQKNLGSALLQEGRVSDAINQFQIALTLRTNDVGAMNNLALAFSREGKTSDALAEYEKALSLQSNDAGVHHNYGMALMRLGRVDEAMAHYQQALAAQPSDPELHNDMANALSKKGQVADAIKEWEKAIQLRTNYFAAENNLAWALATDPD